MRLPVVRTLLPGLHLLETEVEDFDVRAAVLVGTRRAVVWDTLAHPAHMEGVGALTRGLPLMVVYSHVDWDHAWGTSGLDAVEEVVAQAHAAGRFASDVPEELAARRGREPGAWEEVRLVPPTVLFDSALVLDLGGATLELHALPGHTPDCVVGLVPEWGLLLAGDTVETPLPVVNDGGAVGEWAAALSRWAADVRVDTVVPSHGRVGGRELLTENARYLRGLAAGEGPTDPSALSPFYRETHGRNLALVGGGGAPATGGS